MTNPSPIPTQVEAESVANDHVFQNLLADWHDKAESDIPGASVIYKRLCAHIDSIITARVDDKAAQLELMTEYRYNALMQVVKLKRALAVSQAAPAQHTQVVDHSKTLSNQALDTDIRASNTEVVDRQAAPAKAEGWMSIDTAPKDGRTLLLGCFNSMGNWRTMRGQWFTQAEIDNEWEDPDGFEEGWYETAVEPDVPNCWAISPTHWMRTPAAPSTLPTESK